MSMPFVVFVLLLTSTVLGLASAVIIKLKANNLNTNKSGFNLDSKDGLTLNPFKELIFNVADCFLCVKKYQPIKRGKLINNQKNSGCKNVIFSMLF